MGRTLVAILVACLYLSVAAHAGAQSFDHDGATCPVDRAVDTGPTLRSLLQAPRPQLGRQLLLVRGRGHHVQKGLNASFFGAGHWSNDCSLSKKGDGPWEDVTKEFQSLGPTISWVNSVKVKDGFYQVNASKCECGKKQYQQRQGKADTQQHTLLGTLLKLRKKVLDHAKNCPQCTFEPPAAIFPMFKRSSLTAASASTTATATPVATATATANATATSSPKKRSRIDTSSTVGAVAANTAVALMVSQEQVNLLRSQLDVATAKLNTANTTIENLNSTIRKLQNTINGGAGKKASVAEAAKDREWGDCPPGNHGVWQSADQKSKNTKNVKATFVHYCTPKVRACHAVHVPTCTLLVCVWNHRSCCV